MREFYYLDCTASWGAVRRGGASATGVSPPPNCYCYRVLGEGHISLAL